MNKKQSSTAVKVERTGDKTFTVHHDNGNKFKCSTNPGATLSGELATKKERGEATLIGDGVGKYSAENPHKGLMSNADRRKLGVEQDPDLPDLKKPQA